MQFPPFSFMDISIFFVVASIVLLITSEIISSYYGQTKLLINKIKLRNVAYLMFLFFLIIVAINVILIVFSK